MKKTTQDYFKVAGCKYVNVRVIKYCLCDEANTLNLLLLPPTGCFLLSWTDFTNPKAVLPESTNNDLERFVSNIQKEEYCGKSYKKASPRFFFNQDKRWTAGLSESYPYDKKIKNYVQLTGVVTLSMSDKDCIEFVKLLCSVKSDLVE